jgi:hypothetical protein
LPFFGGIDYLPRVLLYFVIGAGAYAWREKVPLS